MNVHTTDLNRTMHAHAGACCWISSCSDCGISSIDISRKIRYGVNRETKGLLTRAAVKKPRRRPRAPEARVVPLVPAGPPRGSSRKRDRSFTVSRPRDVLVGRAAGRGGAPWEGYM